MLGVTIIALALAGAIVGGYLAGIDSVEHEVTRFNELADVSGLYEYDTNPQYIDYDPSSNYTGYYSDDSYSEFLDKYFFAEDYVGFTPNISDGKPVVNNYKIDYAPTVGEPTTVDITSLSDLTGLDGTYRVQYCFDEVHGDVRSWHTTPIYTLLDIINHMEIDSSITNLLITLDGADWDDQPDSSGDIHLETILIIPSYQFNSVGNQLWARIANPNLDLDELKEVVGVSTIYKPYQSFNVDLKTKMVTAYYNVDFEGSGDQYNADKLYVCCDYQRAAVPRLILDTDMDYRTMTTRATYLNPNYGVQLKE